MAKKTTKPVMREYVVPMRLTFNTDVIVEAESLDEVLYVANSGKWKSDGMEGAEVWDWKATGSAKLNE